MNSRVFLLLGTVLAAPLFISPREARANSTPPACEDMQTEACEGAFENAPCDGFGDGSAKCSFSDCMAKTDGGPRQAPVERITVLGCRPVSTCTELAADPVFGAPCVGKTVGAACELTSAIDGATCANSPCDELASTPPTYVAGRYLRCNAPLTRASAPPDTDGSGCSATPSTNGSLLVALGLVATVAAMAKLRRTSVRRID